MQKSAQYLKQSQLNFIKLCLFVLICFTLVYLIKLFDMVRLKRIELNLASVYNREKIYFLNDLIFNSDKKVRIRKDSLIMCNLTIQADLNQILYKQLQSAPKVKIELIRTNINHNTSNQTINTTSTKITYIDNKEPFKIDLDKTEYEFDDIETKLEKSNYKLNFGGQWSPPANKCEPNQHVAIVIPYRDRLSSLKLFLSNMHSFFINQYLSYTVFLIEPIEKLTFNRGLLMNIGFLEAIKQSENKINCFFFHDVDMYAEDKRNIYECDANLPAHYATAVSKFGYS
jgi:hypothetical protein